jgi:hypothetical protein
MRCTSFISRVCCKNIPKKVNLNGAAASMGPFSIDERNAHSTLTKLSRGAEVIFFRFCPWTSLENSCTDRSRRSPSSSNTYASVSFIRLLRSATCTVSIPRIDHLCHRSKSFPGRVERNIVFGTKLEVKAKMLFELDRMLGR